MLAPLDDGPVPIAFGYHSYLRLPGCGPGRLGDRDSGPGKARARQARMLPTGERAAGRGRGWQARGRGPSTTPTSPPRRGRRSWLAGAVGVGSSCVLGPNYRVRAGLRPLSDDDVIAYEAMTAPTNALVTAPTCRCSSRAAGTRRTSRSSSWTPTAERGSTATAEKTGAGPSAAGRPTAPEHQGIVLATLILVAAVANLNLAVANVALPVDRQGVRRRRRPSSTWSRSATRSGSPPRCSTSARSATATGAS